jgi:hypothetical protein
MLCATAVCGNARAQEPPADAAAARALFDEALGDMKAGRWEVACPKLERGMLLDHGTGLRHNLALCYEHTKRPASAWVLFNEVAADAKAQGQTQRAQVARTHAAALEPLLSFLVVSVPSSSLVPGLEVKRDGKLLDPPQWGRKVPVDPGTHVVDASATGRQSMRKEVGVDKEGTAFSVTVPLLPPVAQTPPAAPPQAPKSELTTARKLALVAAGVGVVGVGLGSFFGLRAISKNNQSNDQGCTGDVCTPDAAQTRRDARTNGDISTVGFVIGAAGLAGAVALWIYGKPAATPKTSLIPGPGTLLLQGVF